MVSAGALVSVRIEKPAAGGRMIGRHDGQVVLVGGTIPGERVTARISRVARGVVFADTVSVDEPSPDRRVPSADPACGGNLYAHIQYPRQLSIKGDIVADGLARIGRVTLPAPVVVAASRDDGYRMRARLHVQHGEIGFFREGSQKLCDPRPTRQLLPSTCDALDRLADRLRAPLFDAVRGLEIAENVDASQRVVHLESTAQIPQRDVESLGAIAGLTGLTVGWPGSEAGTPSVQLAWGTPYVTDVLPVAEGSIALRRHVLAFFQGNRYLLADLFQHVASLVGGSRRVTDLYAGVGLFSVAAVCGRRATVVAVEGDHHAAIDLEANAVAAGGIEVVHQAVESFLARPRPAPDVAIVDPPRTGLSKHALTGLLALAAPRIVYVSCDIATMARDVRRLLEGGYVVGRTDAFDLFPNTPHVETVMVLTRNPDPESTSR